MAISGKGIRKMVVDGVSYHYKVSKVKKKKKKTDWRKQKDELNDEFMKYARHYGLGDVRDVTVNVVVQLAEKPVSNLHIKCYSLLVDGFMGPTQILNLSPGLIAPFIQKAIEEGWSPDAQIDFRVQWIHKNTRGGTPTFQQVS